MYDFYYISLEDTNKEIYEEIEQSNEMDKFLSKGHTWFNDERGLIYYFDDGKNDKEIEALISLIKKLTKHECLCYARVLDYLFDDRDIECISDNVRIRLERQALRDFYEKELGKCYKENTDWTYVHYESWFNQKLEESICWTIKTMLKNNDFSINL